MAVKDTEELNGFHELDHAFDVYAIKTVANYCVTVGHIPQEMSN